MRKYITYIWFVVSLVSMASCSIDEFEQDFVPNAGSNEVKIVGRVARFADINVNTKGVKNADESLITSMSLAIFEVNGDGVNASLGKCIEYVREGSGTFNIDRGNYGTGRYAIYVFANVDMPDITLEQRDTLKLSTLLRRVHNVSTESVGIPENGFPMIGSLGDTFSENFDRDGNVLIMSPIGADGKLTDPTVEYADGTKELLPVLQIPMKALYAKINFTIKMDAKQTVEGNYSPQFEMESYEIRNVPKTVDLDNTTNSDNDVTLSIKPDFSGNLVADGESEIEFSFYLPERLLSPVTTWDKYEYPFEKGTYSQQIDGNGNGYRDEDEKQFQRYKPRLLDIDKDTQKPATYVYISGTFRDHQGHYFDIHYTIYLGADNFGDFNILRNNAYNNVVTIYGKETSDDQVLVDHRVNIEHSQPAKITILREVLLDSHFEVRPLRIKKNDIGGFGDINAVKVEVLNPRTTNWMRLERSGGVGTSYENITNENGESIYITDEGASKGKRRYFTYNLVNGKSSTNLVIDDFTNQTLVNSTEVVVPIDDDGECVWIYVDECTEEGDGVRSGHILITYGNLENGEFTPIISENFPPVDFTINQRKLFKVKGGDSGNYYNIEYYEEYLHNYDTDEQYGHTDYEGMQWGLDGVQLSYDNPALFFDSTGGWLDDIFTAIINYIKQDIGVNPQYDFYIPKHDKSVSETAIKRDYRGYVFCNEIIQDVNGNQGRDTDPSNDIDVLTLNQSAKSAIEYCYNKNKRNAEGHVVWQNSYGTSYNQSQLNWYLPAIDEIEDIVMSTYEGGGVDNNNTYGRFPEFQEKYYWSSQPAYVRNHAYYNVAVQKRGKYYNDDINYARATSVSRNQTLEDYEYQLSGVTSDYNMVYIYTQWFDIKYTYYQDGVHDGVALGSITREPGNKERTSMARVRCVRKSSYTKTNTGE